MADLEFLIAQFSDLLLEGSDITMKDIVSAQSNKPSSERNDTDTTDVEPLTAQLCNMDIDAPVQSKPPRKLPFKLKAYCDAAAFDFTTWIPVACHPLSFSQVPETTSGMKLSLNQSGYQTRGPDRTHQKHETQDEMDSDAFEKTQTITRDTYIHYQTWYTYRSVQRVDKIPHQQNVAGHHHHLHNKAYHNILASAAISALPHHHTLHTTRLKDLRDAIAQKSKADKEQQRKHEKAQHVLQYYNLQRENDFENGIHGTYTHQIRRGTRDVDSEHNKTERLSR